MKLIWRPVPFFRADMKRTHPARSCARTNVIDLLAAHAGLLQYRAIEAAQIEIGLSPLCSTQSSAIFPHLSTSGRETSSLTS